MEQRIDPLAAAGFSTDAERYERGRPGYPPETLAILAREAGLRPEAVVVDVGAGTGKFTRLLVTTGARVVAVEPIAEMRARLEAQLPGLDVRVGTAADLPLEDASADLVTAAQAFHWFATHETLAEFARVLRPGGHLGLVWNGRDEGVPWVARITDLLVPFERDSPRFRSQLWRRAFDDQRWFGPLGNAFTTHDQVLPLDTMLDRFSSVSYVAALPEDRRAPLLADIRAVLATAAGADGTVTLPYRTDVFWTARR